MNVSLTPELERFVRDKVRTGLYNNASEVVREALRLMHGHAPAARRPDKAAVIRSIRGIEASLRAKGVSGLHLFGSVARGAAGAGSDVDVLVEIDPKARFSLLDQAGIEAEIAAAVGAPVDVVLKKGLRKELRDAVRRDAERVF